LQFYNGAGQSKATINALGHRTSFTYDAAGQQTAIMNPLGNRSTTVYL